jgi:hypothetical protein
MNALTRYAKCIRKKQQRFCDKSFNLSTVIQTLKIVGTFHENRQQKLYIDYVIENKNIRGKAAPSPQVET